MKSNKVKVSVFLLLFYFSATKLLLAHPPKTIELAYDQDQEILQVTINHVSNNLREHHIRKLIVYVNDEKVESLTLTKQTSAAVLIKNISLKAEENDEIRVKAICKRAGRKEAALVVPELPSDGE